LRYTELQRRGGGFRAGSCAFGLFPAAEREPAAGQQLERSDPPYPRDERELVAARGLDEGVHRTAGVPGLDERGGERHPGRTNETLV